MNNKTLIALSIALASSSMMANAAELYKQDDTAINMGGRVEAIADLGDSVRTHQASADKSRARINIEGTQKLGDLTAKGYYEREFKSAQGSDNTRYAYVALASDDIEAQFGKTAGSLGQISDISDIFSSFGAEGQVKLVSADRAANQMLIIQKTETLTTKVALNGGNDVTNFGANGSMLYANDGLTLGGGVAYEEWDLTNTNQGNNNNALNSVDMMEVMGGIGYQFDALYVGANANYISADNEGPDANILGLGLVGKYAFTDQVNAILGVSDSSFDVDGAKDIDDMTFVDAEINYKLMSQLNLYAGASYVVASPQKEGKSLNLNGLPSEIADLAGLTTEDDLNFRIGAKYSF